jgi:hypothetical protein
MVTDGTWAKMDGLYVFATNSTTTANLNLVSTSYGLTQNGTVTFSANNGYTGDGSTGYFLTGFEPAISGGNWSLNSASMGVCVLSSRSNSSNNYAEMWNGTSLQTSFIFTGNTTYGGSGFGLNGDTEALSASNAKGAWTVSVTSSSQGYVAYNGSTTSTSPSITGISAAQVSILAAYSVSISYYSPDQLAYAFYGGGLTSTQVTAVYNRLHTFLSTVGAASGC